MILRLFPPSICTLCTRLVPNKGATTSGYAPNCEMCSGWSQRPYVTGVSNTGGMTARRARCCISHGVSACPCTSVGQVDANPTAFRRVASRQGQGWVYVYTWCFLPICYWLWVIGSMYFLVISLDCASLLLVCLCIHLLPTWNLSLVNIE